MKKTNSFILILWLLFVLSGCNNKISSSPQASASTPKSDIIFGAEHLSAEVIFNATVDKATIYRKPIEDSNFHPSLWFSKDIQIGDRSIFLILIENRKFNKQGEAIAGHRDGAVIDVVTLEKTSKGWSSEVNYQGGVVEIGSWGKAPAIKDAPLIELSPTVFALRLPTSDAAQGTYFNSEHLIGFDNHKWRDLGDVYLGGNNHGFCKGQEPGATEPDPCYSYTGSISVDTQDKSSYPALKVTRKGTMLKSSVTEDSEPRTLVPANSETYRYVSNKYLSNSEADKYESLHPSGGKGWYTADLNFTKCFESKSSPADRIRLIQDYGTNAIVKDLANGGIEVGVEVGDKTTYWTYFKTIEACMASLPRSQAVPSKYE